MNLIWDNSETAPYFVSSREYWRRVSYVYTKWLTRYYRFLHRRN